MIPDLARGTVETLVVDIEDFLGNMSTLAGAGAIFDVEARGGTPMITGATVTFDIDAPLRAECLVDTNVPILWPAGKYFLYLNFTFAVDAPRLGPMEFHVNP